MRQRINRPRAERQSAIGRAIAYGKRGRYALNYEGFQYHMADNDYRYYLCGCYLPKAEPLPTASEVGA